MRFLIGSLFVLCGVYSVATAQQVNVQGSEPAKSTVAVQTPGQLTFDAVVRSKNGIPVAGLQQTDFTVTLDKKAQTIVSLRQTTPQPGQPPSAQIILVIDTVNTEPADVVNARKQAELYLKRNDGKLPNPVTLIVLADTGVRILPGPTQDGNALSAMLEKAALGLRWENDRGVFADASRFDKSTGGLSQIAAYEAKRPGKKLLIWISPGWPMLVHTKGLLTPQVKEQLFARLVGLSDALRQARITISNVDPVGTSPNGGDPIALYHDSYLKGIPSASKMDFGDLSLQTLARMTGGRVITSSNDVAKAIAEFASDADTYYTLVIAPGAPEHPNEYRSIALKVDKPGLSVTSMTGYYALK